jgi:hypothetical protein
MSTMTANSSRFSLLFKNAQLSPLVDAFTLESDALSGDYCFQLKIRSEQALDLINLIGQSACFTLLGVSATRNFHGILTTFNGPGFTPDRKYFTYSATLQSPLLINTHYAKPNILKSSVIDVVLNYYKLQDGHHHNGFSNHKTYPIKPLIQQYMNRLEFFPASFKSLRLFFLQNLLIIISSLY